ncbi:hypothetical protein [Kordiimonas marina]|uniref:hypothetical protein n=1 Tax=Kordiimonas marina TaxID=2872312 RepID=UPI001FF525F4|nr:hypothetical protein [Kordiimonas marina]MCJ9427895.1 hypothetical protein [Kordiimonas marina]
MRAWDYTLGGGGRELVDEIILTGKPKVMLEIGCFLCASAKRWLSLDPDLTVVGIDPWDDGLIEQCKRYVGRPGLTRAYPDMETQEQFARDIETQGPFLTALANLKGFEDRFIPVRAYSPDVLPALKDAGLEPELIYIDATKKADDLEVSHALWPNARITGDDWHWARTKGYPMRRTVNDFADKHGFTVTADHATWVLTPAK